MTTTYDAYHEGGELAMYVAAREGALALTAQAENAKAYAAGCKRMQGHRPEFRAYRAHWLGFVRMARRAGGAF